MGEKCGQPVTMTYVGVEHTRPCNQDRGHDGRCGAVFILGLDLTRYPADGCYRGKVYVIPAQ
jgi:hypothetical protein